MHRVEKICSLKRESTEAKYEAAFFFFQNSTYKLTIHSASDALDQFLQDLANGMRF